MNTWKEELIRKVSDELHKFHAKCLEKPFDDNPIFRRARKENFAKDIIQIIQISSVRESKEEKKAHYLGYRHYCDYCGENYCKCPERQSNGDWKPSQPTPIEEIDISEAMEEIEPLKSTIIMVGLLVEKQLEIIKAINHLNKVEKVDR